jgi:CDP-diacylglycerol pyrophosphatase
MLYSQVLYSLCNAIGRLLLSVAALLTFVLPSCETRADDARTKLWTIVHDECVVDFKQNEDADPCALTDLSKAEPNGYAILKDINGDTQFLLIPTRRASGIESPELLAADAPNYWQAAWLARTYVVARVGHDLPRNAIGLAINAAGHRTQDQLHIHIDCVKPQVTKSLLDNLNAIGDGWGELPALLADRHFRARRVGQSDLEGMNLFQILQQDSADLDLGQETLVVIGASFGAGRDGFVLLAERATDAVKNSGHGEDLLDSSCAVGHGRP